MKTLFIIPKKVLLCSVLTFLLLNNGCKKANEIIPDQEFVKAPEQMMTALPNPPLDWETAVWMPTPPGVTPIPMPWSSGQGGRKMDNEIVFDYRSEDGWVLVYNNFSTQNPTGIPYFMLYNKYRGLLRSYFYFATESSYPSSNIIYGLKLSPAAGLTSPMLNYAASDVVNFGTNVTGVSQIKPFMVSNTGSWYATEFELAYDPALQNTYYQSMQLNWYITPNSISNINLNGLETGTISGTINQTKASPGFFDGLIGGLVNGVVKYGTSDKVLNPPPPTQDPDPNKNKFLPIIAKWGIAAAVGNATGGIVSGFLSGIIGGGSSTPTDQQVNLSIKSTIATTGTSTAQTSLYDNTFTIPGTLSAMNSEPYFPAYNKKLGIFYVQAKPTVRITRDVYNTEVPATFEGSRTSFTFDTDGLDIVWNPDIFGDNGIGGEATHQNLRTDIIFTRSLTSDFMDRYASSLGEENVAGAEMYNVGTLTLYGIQPLNFVQNDLVVRVSFDVVPNADPSKKVTIVKSFKATGVLQP